MSATMTWRQFLAQDSGGEVAVTTYETPIGKAATVANSRRVSYEVVTRKDAVTMLRNGTVKP